MTDSSELQDLGALHKLTIVGAVLMSVFLIVFLINEPFQYGSSDRRPILELVGLLFFATTLLPIAIRFALKVQSANGRLLLVIIAFAIGLRAVFLCTHPILEIDYYRYMWDGKVTAAGVSPYSYSPAQVLARADHESDEYQTVVALASRSPSNLTILSRIHYEDYTTIYPPVSQFVFRAAMSLVPDSASVEWHALVMKAVLVLFDLASMLMLVNLLALLNRHRAWLIAYAWNPLLLKEIANSSHLDSIAMFLMVASIYLSLRTQKIETSSQKRIWCSLLTGVTLGLAIGAKLIPIVITPAILIYFLRFDWRCSVACGLACMLVAGGTLYPMAGAKSHSAVIADKDAGSESDPKLIPASKEGLGGFLTQWRINDVAFRFFYRNFRTDDRTRTLWYVVFPKETARNATTWIRDRGLGGSSPAFFLARLVTIGIFGVVFLSQIRRFYSNSPSQFLNGLLMIVAMFLLLQPTVNPWYWVLVIPLTCFSNRIGWTLVSGFLLCYYSRFWFKISDPSIELFGRQYQGVEIFDHGVAWIEFACILLALLLPFTIKSADEIAD